MGKETVFKHVDDLWRNDEAERLSAIDRLVYRSNKLGQDQRITNTGGGNTSAKLTETDPLTGKPVEVLWVKGSGGDLRTAGRENFASLYMDRLLALPAAYAARSDTGPKSPAEDDMVAMYRHCTFNLNPRASSIDTPLHALVPHKHVDHTHPNAVIAIAASRDGERITREVYGDDLYWVPWLRPGFELALALQRGCAEHPRAKGAILGQHGLISWADEDRECYRQTLELIERAASFIEGRDRGGRTFGGPRFDACPADRRLAVLLDLLPWLRGRLSTEKRMIGTVQADAGTLRFVDSVDAPRLAELGTSCPDHFLRTKIKPLYIDWDPHREDAAGLRDKIDAGLEQYRRDYAAYYQTCRRPESPLMRRPDPTVVLIPGLGMITWGKNKSESRVTAEFYNCAIEVMRGAEALGGYVALPQQEAFDIEYWPLEDAKLRRMPLDKTLSGHVCVVVGAGSGIGRATALRLAREDGHVACVDLDPQAAAATAAAIIDETGEGVGVAGTGNSSCGAAIDVACDVRDRHNVRSMLHDILLAYGGIDDLVITAGLFPTPSPEGNVSDEAWNRTFAVNVLGTAVVADEAAKIMRVQQLAGAMVLVTSVNAVVAKKGSMAYDTSKAAVNHLVRELAVAHAPRIRVNGVAPATVVKGSTMFPRERVIASLTKYGIPFDEGEDVDTLTQRLTAFYAQRNLLAVAIYPEDQAEVIYHLLGPTFSKTTGQIIHVDGGLTDAFLR